MSTRAWFRSLRESPPEPSVSVLADGRPQGSSRGFSMEEARSELAQHFKLDDVLARSPWSTVYAAREIETDRRVALRVFARPALEAAGLEAQLQSAIAEAMLNHPHIVPIYRYGFTPGLVWYSMRFIEGRSLAAILADSGALEFDECLRIIEQLASGLAYAHGRGVAHGAIHPDNIVLDLQGWALLSDLRVSALMRTASGEDDVDPWRAAYVAPEEGNRTLPGPRGDQYALAVTVYECLTGELPFAGDTLAAMRPSKLAPPRLADQRPDLPAWVSNAVLKAMSPRPEERFPTILDFVSALKAAGPMPTPMLGVARSADMRDRLLTVDRPSRWRRRIATVALVALICVGALALGRYLGVRPDSAAVDWVALPDEGPADLSTSNAGPPGADATSEPTADSEATASAPAENAEGEAGPEEAAASAPTDVEPAPPPEESTAPASNDAAASPPQPAADEASEVRPEGAERDSGNEAPASVARPASEAGSDVANELGRLYVSSLPWGEVHIDGQPAGNTPLLDFSLPPGRHVITILRDGFLPLEREIFVEPGAEIRLIDLTLEAKP